MAVSCEGNGTVTVLEKKTESAGDGIVLTEFAAQKVKSFLEKANGKFLRVSVLPGGCAGFSYDFTVEQEAKKDDKAFGSNGVSLIADEFSTEMLHGSKIDWVETLQGAGLSVKRKKIRRIFCAKKTSEEVFSGTPMPRRAVAAGIRLDKIISMGYKTNQCQQNKIRNSFSHLLKHSEDVAKKFWGTKADDVWNA